MNIERLIMSLKPVTYSSRLVPDDFFLYVASIYWLELRNQQGCEFDQIDVYADFLTVPVASN